MNTIHFLQIYCSKHIIHQAIILINFGARPLQQKIGFPVYMMEATKMKLSIS